MKTSNILANCSKSTQERPLPNFGRSHELINREGGATLKKKAISCAIVFLVFLLAGCGSFSYNKTNSGIVSLGKATDSNDKITLTVWHPFAGMDLRSVTIRGIMEQFQADNPNIILDVQAIPHDGYRSRLKTIAAANELPDLFIMWPGVMTQEFVGGDLIQPVNDLIDNNKAWKDGFLPDSFDDFTVADRIYSIPTGLSPTSILYYNKKILDQYALQVPTTWEELILDIEVLKKYKVTPIALGNKAAWPAQSSILSSLGDRITGSDWFLNAAAGKGNKFTDPSFIDALKHLQQLQTAGAFQMDFNGIDTTEAVQIFAKGEAAMLIDGGWALPLLAANASKEVLDTMDVTGLPAIAGGKGKPNAISSIVSTGLALNKKVKGAQKEAAYKLMYAVAGPEAQKQYVDNSQLVSFKVEPDVTKVSSLFIKVSNLLSRVDKSPVYDGVLSSETADVMNNSLQGLLIGQKPEEVARKIQEALDKALK
jgi:raffinose/stachyose/melibiose transport system substrate-binding protein